MADLLDCVVDEKTISAWKDNFVPDRQPFFFRKAWQGGLPDVPSSGWGSLGQLPLSQRDTFAVSEVSKSLAHVYLLTEDAFIRLKPEEKQKLLNANYEGGRGAIFRLNDWTPELEPSDC